MFDPKFCRRQLLKAGASSAVLALAGYDGGSGASASDAEISFQTQAGERDVYLAVVGAPATIHKHAFLDGYPLNNRYPYEFRVSGAIPSGFEPGSQNAHSRKS